VSGKSTSDKKPAATKAERKKRRGPSVVLPDDPRLEKAKLLDVRQVADLLGLGVSTTRRAAAAGEIPAPAVRIGQRILRWRLTDIQAFVQGARP